MDSDTDSLERTIQNDTSSHAMGNIKSEPEEDPLEGSSYNLDMSMKAETTNEEDDDEEYNTMALLELAQCVQTNHDPIEFDSTEAAVNPKTGLMMCLHCYEDVDSNLLADHMINAHSYRRLQLKCRICDTTFQERKVLIIHRKECQPPAKKAKRRTFQQIMREVESSLDTNIYDMVTCPICVLEMAKYTLKDHLINAHSNPDMVLTCAKCNKNFKSRLTLREHVRLVHESIEDSVECELCGQKFRSYKYLSNHKRNVHPKGGQVHICAKCGKQFKSRLCLHQHTKYVHPPESASVNCPQCRKRFKSRINLHQHIRISHNGRHDS
ncbi:PREDICTED: zinc finger protein 652-like [Papilio xuthus]|uniref:Zinc finger protein 652-like n=2 Tax=Papilio xuthus TaxID=66420 RepID=A0AAJ6Z259_PAPXU|nr:PREDICTED: zinc finger protein 652-like [Papilio xuthus]